MKDAPGVNGAGKTDMPKTNGSLADKAMKDAPGTKGGQTNMPNANPTDGSLAGKEMKDAPGVQ